MTGPTSGIGLGITLALAAKEINLVLVARNREKLTELRDKLKTEHPTIKIDSILIDLANPTPEADAALIRRLQDRNHPIKLLINNAALNYKHHIYFHKQTLEHHQAMLRVNVEALLRYTYYLVSVADPDDSTVIVNMSSYGALFPNPKLATYGATKSFVEKFTEALYEEYKGRIHFEYMTPFYVVSNITGGNDRSTRFMMPHWRTYGASVVDTIGRVRWSYPYWSHVLYHTILYILPEFVTKLIFMWTFIHVHRSPEEKETLAKKRREAGSTTTF